MGREERKIEVESRERGEKKRRERWDGCWVLGAGNQDGS